MGRIGQLARVEPAARTAVDIALGRQLTICVLYGDDAYRQMLRQGALAGQMLMGRDGAGDNVVTNLLVQIFIEALRTSLGKIVVEHQAAPGLIPRCKLTLF